jgi:hypothetical protein
LHAVPGQDDGRGIPPDLAPEQLSQVLEHCEADLVMTGALSSRSLNAFAILGERF